MSYPMGYRLIDDQLYLWASKYGVHIYTSYKDEDVRSIDIVDPLGIGFQIWLDPPASDASTTVHVWDFKKRSKEFPAGKGALAEALEKARAQVCAWSGCRDWYFC